MNFYFRATPSGNGLLPAHLSTLLDFCGVDRSAGDDPMFNETALAKRRLCRLRFHGFDWLRVIVSVYSESVIEGIRNYEIKLVEN